MASFQWTGARAPTRRSDDGIDALRGLACILLVTYHVVGSQPDLGLELPAGHPLHLVVDSFLYIRMPLFAALSGFVYGLKPVRPGGLGAFASGKARRILAPWLFAVTAFAATASLTGAGHAVPLSEAWRIYAFGYAHFWFLQALLVIFAVIALADLAWPGRPRAVAGILFAIAVVPFLNRWLDPATLFSVNSACYLAPFFFAGLGLQRIGGRLALPLASASAGLLAAGMVWHVWRVLTLGEAALDIRSPLSLLVGLTSVAALVSFRRPVPALAAVGHYSFAIYLYHVFATAGVRMLINRLAELPTGLDLALGVTAGLAFPILLERLVRNRGWISTLMLGQSLEGPARTARPVQTDTRR